MPDIVGVLGDAKNEVVFYNQIGVFDIPSKFLDNIDWFVWSQVARHLMIIRSDLVNGQIFRFVAFSDLFESHSRLDKTVPAYQIFVNVQVDTKGRKQVEVSAKKIMRSKIIVPEVRLDTPPHS